MADDLKRKRAGGRAGNAIRAGSHAIDQMPWRIPVNHDRPTEPMGEDGDEDADRRVPEEVHRLGDVPGDRLTPERPGELVLEGVRCLLHMLSGDRIEVCEVIQGAHETASDIESDL